MKQLILCCWILVCHQNLSAQILESIRQKYISYDSVAVQEKVYVQTDRTLYAPNESIWFNAFISNGKNAPSNQSEQVYAELYSPNGTMLDKATLQNEEGGAKGMFQLGVDAIGGVYKLRVYTYWMQNFGETTYFEKKITVQKVVLPEVLMELDFEREAYGVGDKVIANFRVRTKENRPLVGKILNYTVQVEGAILYQASVKTDENGKALIGYELPEKLNSTDNLLNVSFQEDGLTESIARSAPIILNKLDIQLLPEGGNIIANQTNRIAVKVLNEFGQPADIEGEIINRAGKVVSNFKTFHQGMGAFEILPQKNETYKLRVTQPLGIRQKWELPAVDVNKLGIYIKKQEKERLTFDIYSPKEQTVFVVAQQQGNLIYTQVLEAKEGLNSLAFSTEKFPMGIVQLTLLDTKEQVHAERLVFVNYHRKLAINIKPNKANYLPREKVTLDISVKDETGRGIQGDFSMAVVDDKQHTFIDDKQDNILSYLLMSSELKGAVYEPDFYFDPKNEKAKEALDYVLLTHGWRRFEWEKVLTASTGLILNYPIKNKEISGYLKIGDQLGKNQMVFLSEGQARYTKKKAIAAAQTDENGFFKFENIMLHFPAFLSTTYHGEYQSIRINQYSKSGINSAVMSSILYQDQISAQGYYYNEKDGKLYDRYNKQLGVLEGDIVDQSGTFITNSKRFKIQNKRIESEKGVVRIDEEGYVFDQQDLISKQPLNANQNIAGIQLGPGKVGKVVMDSLSVPKGGFLDVAMDGYYENGYVETVRLNVDKKLITKDRLASITSSVSVYHPSNIERMNGVNMNRYNVKDLEQDDLRKLQSLQLVQMEPVQLQYKVIPKFYEPNYTKNPQPSTRQDFRKTIYWNPKIQTNEKGKASISYHNSDQITTFRVILEGYTKEGKLGRQEETYSTSLPFNLVTKIPSTLSFGDTVKMPVVLKNNSSKSLTGELMLELPDFLNLLEVPSKTITIPADSQYVLYLNYQVAFKAAQGALRIGFKSKGLQDVVKQVVETTPKGFPIDFAMSGQSLEQRDTFIIQNPYEGSLKSELKFYINPLEGLIDGVESILNSPSGCFEQVSSSNYPNILALQLMEQTNQLNASIREKALGYLETGYKKLAAYEIQGGGFEWYGRAPAHEGLTAYGLVQFKDMKTVYDPIDPTVIQRTQDYLLSRRDGKGGFQQNVGKYGFSGNKPALFNAYITWALSEVNTRGIQKEVEAMTKEAIASEDLYRMSLAALTHFNLGNKERATNLLKTIQDMVRKVGVEQVRAESTVTYSYGDALNIETLSFAALVMLKSDERDERLLVDIIEHILSKRRHGRFGSTQSTVMALKALSAYASNVIKQQEDKLVKVFINGKVVLEMDYKKEQKENMSINHLHQYLVEGENSVCIKFDATTQGLPYSFDIGWTSKTPKSAEDCPVKLISSLNAQKTTMGQTVRLELAVQNTKKEGIPSTMALIGIPAGLSVQTWQLKDLQEKQQFAFYELKDNYLILYYRELDGQETKRLSLDLKTEVPGCYTAPANTTYLYYGEETKYWSDGATIEIN